MMEEWSERDKAKLQETQDRMRTNMEALKKELRQDHAPRKHIDRDKEKSGGLD